MSSRGDLVRERLEAIRRVALGEYPTALQPLPALSRELGRPLFIKRDDLLGPGGGGNKTRKLEYLLADARATGATKVSTFGGLQSNHARLTAAAARLLGMEPHLFYFAPRPEKLEGNLVLAELLGAQMHFLGRGIRRHVTVERGARAASVIARRRLGPHYVITLGGHSVLGALGYVRAALELDEQAAAQGIEGATVVVAAGTGGTLAGLMAGLALIESPLRLMGIDVGALWKDFPASVARLAGEVCERLGRPTRFEAAQVPLVERTYVGRRYGRPTPEGLAALRKLAQREGVFLDPVYTAKAFAGMLDLLARDAVPSGAPVIFVHTGGQPALYATLPPP